DDLPAGALVVGDVDVVGAGVELVRVVGRDLDREGPLEAVFMDLRRRGEAVELRPDTYVARLVSLGVPGAEAPVTQAAADRAAEDGVRLGRLDRDVAGLAAARHLVVVPGDRAVEADARHAHGRVVLLRAVDVVGRLVVDGDVIELRGRLVHDRRPAQTAVEADDRAAVVALDDAVRVLWVDPDVVVVAVRGRDHREGLAGVDRLEELLLQDPDGVLVGGVGVDMAVVPVPGAQRRVVVDVLPVRAAV